MPRDGTLRVNRRQFIRSAGVAGGVGVIAGCLSASEKTSGSSDFPERDIDLIIPFGPGGGYDTYSRLTFINEWSNRQDLLDTLFQNN